ncbi:uncharacterized protein LOC125509957 [Triticum urartu]|uniref:uncharacterized protein LOC125509953 n=1 Tax=Triticum urartu TaxID=4572 RepID=UPI00204469BA|nr:uncharacterized protein LOC125509953 [Triticum urartu]XP_048530991.1 uncharacterized protein LOC125509957 [Triticum urartu]
MNGGGEASDYGSSEGAPRRRPQPGHNSRMLKLSAVTTHTTKHSYCMKSRSYVVEAAAAANRSLGHGRAAAMGRRGGEQRLSEAVRIWVYKGIDLAEIKKEFQNIPRRMPLPQSIKLYYSRSWS